MRTTCSLVAAVWFLAGTALAGEAAPATKDVGDAKKLLDLPEASAGEYAQVEGTWELTQDTGQAGKVRRVKTHQGGKTSVTAYSPEGKIVGQHKSEYKLKQSGMARIFIYSKVVPTMGPSEGRELPGPFYYAYSVHDDTFIEFYGLLAGDDRSPRMLLWKRAKTKTSP